jgi:hypothetical protein
MATAFHTDHLQMDLIHYGACAWDRSKFNPIVDQHWIKPSGGLWTSPKDAEFGWKHWCLGDDYNTESLSSSFSIVFEGNVLVIDCEEDLDKLVWVQLTAIPSISFETLQRSGVDAIYLTWKGQCATRWSSPRDLYGWDCESVLIMNPDTLTYLV